MIGSNVRRIFEWGAANLRMMKTKRKISQRRISSYSCRKSGEDQKKSLHSNLVRFLVKNQVYKKRSLSRFCPFLSSNFLPKLPCHNFAYYSMLIILSWRPKGEGHGTIPPLNTPLIIGDNMVNCCCHFVRDLGGFSN